MKHAQVSWTLANVKRDSVLETESVVSLEGAFAYGHFRISLEQDRFKMTKTFLHGMCISLLRCHL